MAALSNILNVVNLFLFLFLLPAKSFFNLIYDTTNNQNHDKQY